MRKRSSRLDRRDNGTLRMAPPANAAPPSPHRIAVGRAQSGSGDVIVRRQQFIHVVLPSISKNSGVSGKAPRLRKWSTISR